MAHVIRVPNPLSIRRSADGPPATCHQVTLETQECLIEIETRSADGAAPRCVARVSVLENGGGVVRPLVFADRRPLTITAATEPAALAAAIECLTARFGAVRTPERECSLGSAAIGFPFIIATADDIVASQLA